MYGHLQDFAPSAGRGAPFPAAIISRQLNPSVMISVSSSASPRTSGQQHALAAGQTDCVVIRLVTERARHAAAAGVGHVAVQPLFFMSVYFGVEMEYGLVMTVAVHQRLTRAAAAAGNPATCRRRNSLEHERLPLSRFASSSSGKQVASARRETRTRSSAPGRRSECRADRLTQRVEDVQQQTPWPCRACRSRRAAGRSTGFFWAPAPDSRRARDFNRGLAPPSAWKWLLNVSGPEDHLRLARVARTRAAETTA